MKISLHQNSITIRATAKERFEGRTSYLDEMDVEDAAGRFQVGSVGTLATETDLRADRVRAAYLASEDGVSGNSDPSIRRTAGWRGTYNDVCTYAYGVIRVTEKQPLARGLGYRIAFERVNE